MTKKYSFTKTEKLLDKFLELGVPGYAIAVMKDGECIFSKKDGYSSLEDKTPVTGKESYYMYSCTKVLTCTAALMLYEKGAFKLDDPVAKYLPEFANMKVKAEDGTLRPAEKPMLVHHLFSMTAGFDYNLQSPSMKEFHKDTDGRCPTREFARYLSREPLFFEPGTRYNYSLCHDVLGVLIEVWSGERLSDFMKKNIFEPLGMKNTLFRPTEEEKERICPLYIFGENNGKMITRLPSTISYQLGTEFDSGGAGSVSTLDDFVLFLEALRTYKLLSPDTVRLMSTDRIGGLYDDFELAAKGYGYGLGVRCRRADGHPNSLDLYDFGWQGAAGSHAAVDTENGISVVYVQHMLNYPNHEHKKDLVRTITAEILAKDN